MRRPKPIPPFKTLEAEAHFWDTHSVADFWDDTKRVKVVFEPEAAKDTVIHFKLEAKLKKLLREKAKRQASTVSQLLRLWVYQKLSESPR